MNLQPTSPLKKTCAYLAIALLGASSMSLVAKEFNSQKIQKEMKIMRGIFEVALKESPERHNRHFASRGIEPVYLAKQGMLFEFNFSGPAFTNTEDWALLGEGIGNLVGEIASEVGVALGEIHMAPDVSDISLVQGVPDVPDAPDLEIDLESRMGLLEDRYEALEQAREEHQQQRETIRQLQREIRQLEKKTTREDSKSTELDKLKQELKLKSTELEEKMETYKESMTQYRKKRSERLAQTNQKKSDVIFSTLCDYGSSLKSLDKDEYVTLIFKNFNPDQDQVYVLEARDVKDCSSKDKLMQSAISYSL